MFLLNPASGGDAEFASERLPHLTVSLTRIILGSDIFLIYLSDFCILLKKNWVFFTDILAWCSSWSCLKWKKWTLFCTFSTVVLSSYRRTLLCQACLVSLEGWPPFSSSCPSVQSRNNTFLTKTKAKCLLLFIHFNLALKLYHYIQQQLRVSESKGILHDGNSEEYFHRVWMSFIFRLRVNGCWHLLDEHKNERD